MQLSANTSIYKMLAYCAGPFFQPLGLCGCKQLKPMHSINICSMHPQHKYCLVCLGCISYLDYVVYRSAKWLDICVYKVYMYMTHICPLWQGYEPTVHSLCLCRPISPPALHHAGSIHNYPPVFCSLYTVKKVSDFSVSSRDATNIFFTVQLILQQSFELHAIFLIQKGHHPTRSIRQQQVQA